MDFGRPLERLRALPRDASARLRRELVPLALAAFAAAASYRLARLIHPQPIFAPLRRSSRCAPTSAVGASKPCCAAAPSMRSTPWSAT
jgi:hypothetical protein